MYHDFYGLKSDPFRMSPDHGFCLRHPGFAKVKAYIRFALEMAEDVVIITGLPGTGKTTLADDLRSDLEGHEVITIDLACSQLEVGGMLFLVAHHLGLASKGKKQSVLLMELQRLFARMRLKDKRPLLFIDEAQSLSHSALAELRLLARMPMRGKPIVQILLIGQNELRELAINPDKTQARQDMIVSYHLGPLDFHQTAAYVIHRLNSAGWQGRPVLHARIYQILYHFSRGTPRLINQFMGRLLMHGWLEAKDVLTEDDGNIVLKELSHEHLAPSHAKHQQEKNGLFRNNDIADMN